MNCHNGMCIGEMTLALTLQNMTTPLLQVIADNEQIVLHAREWPGTCALCICHWSAANHHQLQATISSWQEANKKLTNNQTIEVPRDCWGDKACVGLRARTQWGSAKSHNQWPLWHCWCSHQKEKMSMPFWAPLGWQLQLFFMNTTGFFTTMLPLHGSPTAMLLSAEKVLTIGLSVVNCQPRHFCKKSTLIKKFKSFHGPLPLVLSLQWKDWCTMEVARARVDEKSQNEKGFRLFMCVHHFFCFPKNGMVLGLFLATMRAECNQNTFETCWNRSAIWKKDDCLAGGVVQSQGLSKDPFLPGLCWLSHAKAQTPWLPCWKGHFSHKFKQPRLQWCNWIAPIQFSLDQWSFLSQKQLQQSFHLLQGLEKES